jgi:hypothetical protein
MIQDGHFQASTTNGMSGITDSQLVSRDTNLYEMLFILHYVNVLLQFYWRNAIA